MGTSTRNSGQSGHNPLLPTWLDGDGISPHPGVEQPAQPGIIAPQQPIPQEADPNRFRGPRTSFTHFVSGGGRDSGSMRRGVSNYVKRSLGGSSNAAKRLGSSRASTARLYGVLNTLSSAGGLQEVARLLSLDSLEGLIASEFFIKIATFICPDGGPNDEGISRSAYYDTVADNPDIMGKPTENLSQEEIDSILQKYMTKVVMQQVMNGIANNTIRFSKTLDEISHIEDVVEQLIEQGVADSFAQVRQENADMTNERAREITDSVYQRTFNILEEAGD
jgi:hypothetical protein